MTLWPDERIQHLEAALDALDDAVMVVDRELCVVGFNRAAEKLTGFSRREALGSRCFEVCGGRFCKRLCDIESLFATSHPPEDFETPVLSKDGQLRIVRVRTVPLKGRGNRILAAVRILRDVTPAVPQPGTPVGGSRAEPGGGHPGGEAAGSGAGGPGERVVKVYGELVGQSPAMMQLYRALAALRDSEYPILLWGPPGTEKEWVALTLHRTGLRAGGPFVRVVTAGSSPMLVDAELFGPAGPARGEPPAGALRTARGGTLFVDDVAELSPAAQERLFALLEEHRLQRELDVRLVAGSAYALGELARVGRFHARLADLLDASRLRIPPLGERIEDIPLLVEKLLDMMTPPGQPVPRLTDRALRALLAHPFPGNVQELERILRVACVTSRGPVVDVDHLPLPAHGLAAGTVDAEGVPAGADRLARERLMAVLEAHHWHMGRTARALGIDRTTLWRRMKRLGIRRPA